MKKQAGFIFFSLALAAAAQAAPLANGGFEAGLSDWSVTGDAAARGATFGVSPAQGAWQLLLGTASASQADDAPLAVATFNLSGAEPEAAGFALETFVGLAPGGLDPDAANAVQAYEGSAARQVFDAAAGSTLNLRYNLLTNETGTSAQQDYAFVVIDGQLLKLADASGATAAWNGTGAQTGYGNFSFTFATGGSHTLALGVVDVGDYDRSSLLAVDAVTVSAVPEPSAWVLMAFGLGALALMRLRTQP